MSLLVAQNHVFARYAMPRPLRCSAMQARTVCGPQRLITLQRSLSSCSALRLRQSSLPLNYRVLRQRTSAFAREASYDSDEDEDDVDQDDLEDEAAEDAQELQRQAAADVKALVRRRKADEDEVHARSEADAADDDDAPGDEEDDGFQERVVQVRRVTKVAKGGKSMSFRYALFNGCFVSMHCCIIAVKTLTLLWPSS